MSGDTLDVTMKGDSMHASHAPVTSRSAGFSLVEMMVAVAIGLFLIGGAIAMLVTSKRTYTVQEDLGRIQENGRFAVEYLARDLRMAGYFGCGHSLGELFNHVNGADNTLFDTRFPVEGYEQGAAAWLPSGSVERIGDILPGTDAITLRYIQPSQIQVTNMNQPSAQIFTTVNDELREGDIIAVSDCESTDVFQISGPSGANPGTTGNIVHNTGAGTPGNAKIPGMPNCPGANSHCLSKVYGPPDGRVMKLAAYRYYVGNDAQGNPALFREAIQLAGTVPTPTPVQLIDGVENLQILYGVDTTGDRVPDAYIPADGNTGGVDLTTESGWDNVVGVRIALLLRSVEETGTDVDNRQYTVGTENLGPFNDRRRRRVFGTTVLMRNLATLVR